MKFLCDRCKTRYSIADERVRGKILKIRCKNCSAVISVREGMDEPAEWAAPVPASAPSPVASAPVRPPPASLHEEWYVSLDGNQEGPFLLPEAQAWVSAKAPEDELHCWCEGFDDWLPIEKVSHFRGLRGKVTRARTPSRAGVESTPPPAPQAPPPPREPEPKPLFAATLAAMEADAEKEKAEKAEKAAAAAAAKPAMPVAATAPAPAALPRLSPTAAKATPATGAAKVAAPPIPRAATPAAGLPKAAAPALGSHKPAAASAPPLPAAAMAAPLPATPRVGAGLPPVQALTGPAGAPIPSASSSTSIPRPAPMFDTGPESMDGGNGNGQSAPAVGDEPLHDPIDDIEDDLAIGEVSRVVRLADIAKALPPRKAAAAPAAAAAAAAAAARNATASTAAIARGTGMVARVEPTDAGADVSPGVEGAPSMYQSLVAVPPRRRTLLYVGAAVVVLALAAIVILIATSRSGEDEQIAGGATRNYDDVGGTVDNPLIRRPGLGSQADAGVGPGTGSGRRPTGSGGRPGGSGSNGGSQTSSGSSSGQQTSQIGPDGMPLRPLTPDDVFAMSSKMEIGTRRCYERAMKDDPFLKVTKIKATVVVKNTGIVSNVTLSSMQGTPLATCLTAAIGRWRFRASTEGIVSEFALVFEQR